ncbi:MAG: ribosome silencing factor [Flavobacteriales bacterium]|nr:ribosome silencing factor [Flavobacteriales bacterium]
MTKKKGEEKEILLETIIQGIQEVKGNNIVCLDLSEIPASVTDKFVICDGSSSTQVDAIANKVEEFTYKKLDQKPWKKEGYTNSNWIILDYFDIVVHVFSKEARALYDLEGLWADAKIKEIAMDL